MSDDLHDLPDYQYGERVDHDDWGLGTVLREDCWQQWTRSGFVCARVVVVHFDTGGKAECDPRRLSRCE